MPNFRMNNELRDSLKRRLANIYDNKIDALGKTTKPTVWGDAIYKVLMQEYFDKFDDIPSVFLNETNSFVVHGFTNAPVRVNDGSSRGAIRMTLSSNRPWPKEYRFFSKELVYKCDYSGFTLIGDATVWGKAYTEIVAFQRKLAELQLEKQNAVRALSDVVTQASTFKQVLEAWPAVMELTPQSYKELYAAPKVPNAEKEKQIVVDNDALAKLTTELVAGRITK